MEHPDTIISILWWIIGGLLTALAAAGTIIGTFYFRNVLLADRGNDQASKFKDAINEITRALQDLEKARRGDAEAFKDIEARLVALEGRLVAMANSLPSEFRQQVQSFLSEYRQIARELTGRTP